MTKEHLNRDTYEQLEEYLFALVRETMSKQFVEEQTIDYRQNIANEIYRTENHLSILRGILGAELHDIEGFIVAEGVEDKTDDMIIYNVSSTRSLAKILSIPEGKIKEVLKFSSKFTQKDTGGYYICYTKHYHDMKKFEDNIIISFKDGIRYLGK